MQHLVIEYNQIVRLQNSKVTQMENFTYERDYSSKWDEQDPQCDAFWDELSGNGFFEEVRDYKEHAPRLAGPSVQKQYDFMVKQADAVARDFGGTVKAVIDYTEYRAYIRVTIPFFSIDNAEALVFMMSALAFSNLHIDVSADGNSIVMNMHFGYFVDLHSAEDAEQFAAKAKEKLRAAHEAAARQLEEL